MSSNVAPNFGSTTEGLVINRHRPKQKKNPKNYKLQYMEDTIMAMVHNGLPVCHEGLALWSPQICSSMFLSRDSKGGSMQRSTQASMHVSKTAIPHMTSRKSGHNKECSLCIFKQPTEALTRHINSSKKRKSDKQNGRLANRVLGSNKLIKWST